MRRTALVALATLLTLTSACSVATGPFGRVGREGASRDELRRLKQHILELEQNAAMAEVEIRRLRARLAELEAESGSPADAGTEPTRDVEPVPAAGAPPTQPIGVPGQPALEVTDLPVERVPPSAPADPPARPAASGSALDATAQALYDRGYTLFHQGRFLDSETAFQQFLRSYSQTVLGDNAQFWIAEARYARGDVRGALAAYEETAQRFQDGNKVPDALLKAGDCLRDLGEAENARAYYRRVLDEYPRSGAAAAAQKRLDGTP